MDDWEGNHGSHDEHHVFHFSSGDGNRASIPRSGRMLCVSHGHYEDREADSGSSDKTDGRFRPGQNIQAKWDGTEKTDCNAHGVSVHKPSRLCGVVLGSGKDDERARSERNNHSAVREHAQLDGDDCHGHKGETTLSQKANGHALELLVYESHGFIIRRPPAHCQKIKDAWVHGCKYCNQAAVSDRMSSWLGI